MELKILDIITKIIKLLVTLYPSLTVITLEQVRVDKTIIESSKTITGKVMSLYLKI